MKIALATPLYPTSIDNALEQIETLTKEAKQEGAVIVCFPETLIPGYPLEEFTPEQSTPQNMQYALDSACAIAAKHTIAIILPMDWYEGEHFLNVAFVIDETGKVQGYQAKNQLDPSEDDRWVAGKTREIFEISGLKFGITICHEGFRYPETVRWAARNGAAVVFHPHFAGSNNNGTVLTEWGNKDNPYYEKAMMMRALENTIYFASVNYATKYQESGSAVIAPDGTCVAYQQYGKPGVLMAEINPAIATAKLANRFKPALYQQ